MPKRMKKTAPKSWIERIFSFRILSIPAGTWLLMLGILSFIVGINYLIFRESENPATVEIFIAEVSEKWYVQHDSETGGSRVYRAKLKRDEDEFTCNVSPFYKNVWYKLEQGKKYEFEVARSRSNCYINKASEIETKGIVSGGD
jgi:hypothetical protein